LKDIQVVRDSPFAQYTLLVEEFEDARDHILDKESRHSEAFSARVVRREGEIWFYNRDARYGKHGVAQWVTKAVVKHMDKAGLFKDVGVLEGDAITSDFLLRGKIEKFEAIKSPKGALLTQTLTSGFSAFGALGGLVGGLFAAAVDSKYEAITRLSGMALMDANTDKVIWEGEVEQKLVGHDHAMADMVYQEANQSLKQAIDVLIQELSDVDPLDVSTSS